MARRLIGVVVLLLAVAACGGDPKADPSPAPSTSPVSTTPSAPAMPEAAKENSKAGAIAFVRHYVELINYAQATGDVSRLATVEEDRCESCSKVHESIEAIYGAGGHIEGGAWHPHFKVALPNDDGSWLVSGFIAFDPEHVRRSSGSPLETQPGGSAVSHLTVKKSGEGWKVVAWSRES